MINPDSGTVTLWLQKRHLVAKQGVGEKCPLILPTKYICHTPQGSLTCRKIYDEFTSPPKESVPRIFIVLRNP
jgi:hypothetical protein